MTGGCLNCGRTVYLDADDLAGGANIWDALEHPCPGRPLDAAPSRGFRKGPRHRSTTYPQRKP